MKNMLAGEDHSLPNWSNLQVKLSFDTLLASDKTAE